MATLITLVDGTIPVAADFNTNFVNLNTEVRTVPYGGTGAATLTSNGVLLGQGTSAITATTAGSANQVLRIPGAGGAPAFGTIDLAQSAAVTGVLAVANGGTGIAYFTVAGPTVARTYTFPDASTTILTTNAAVTVAQGGTGLASGTSGGILGFTAAGTLASSAALTANALLLGGGAGATPSALALGTANYILGMNSGATANEYKQLVEGSNVTITHAAGSVTIAAAAGLAAATQAEMEAATSTTVAASPGTTQYHPGVAKAWAKWDDAGAISVSYNTTSITDTGVGDHTWNIGTDFSSADWVATFIGGTGEMLWRLSTQAAGSQRLILTGADSPFNAADPALWFAAGFGDQ